MKKILCGLLVFIMAVSLLTACGENSRPLDAEGSSGNPSTGTKRTDVVVGVNLSMNTLDPMHALQRPEQEILDNVQDTLLLLVDGSYQGNLAEHFSVSEDGMQITIKLREGIKFHNGDELTTEDIAYTYDSLSQSTLFANDATYYDRTEIMDDYNCVIHAAVQNPLFMLTLCNVNIISEQAVNELAGDYAMNPVGTGAYKFVRYDGFNNVVLEANEDYWGGAPEIKKLTYRIFSDNQTMTMALEAGEIDIIGSLDPTSAIQYDNNSNFKTTWKESDGISLLLFNVNCAPFDKKEVRQAISYAIDREAINLIVGEGRCKITDAFYTERMAAAPDYDDLPHYEFDLDKAKELMASAGLADGFALEEPVRIVAEQEKLTVALQEQLSEIGISFNIEILESNTLFSNYLFVNNYNMMPFGLSTETYDRGYVAQFYDMNSSMPNMTGYENPDFSNMIIQANHCSNLEERKELYTEMWKIAAEDLPICPIMANMSAEVCNADLVNDDSVYPQLHGINFHWK